MVRQITGTASTIYPDAETGSYGPLLHPRGPLSSVRHVTTGSSEWPDMLGWYRVALREILILPP